MSPFGSSSFNSSLRSLLEKAGIVTYKTGVNTLSGWKCRIFLQLFVSLLFLLYQAWAYLRAFELTSNHNVQVKWIF